MRYCVESLLAWTHYSLVEDEDLKTMTLLLSHSLSRYKLKFSSNDDHASYWSMDELEKEINTYSMHVREWFGWHFPEMGKIVTAICNTRKRA
ncbi:hypothetical protein PsorP6_012456 [Peronosclerospora sorghi]|uniref:Uncharacterized protein n=1 Tax=Peronosclerospora sorghi TaxID=230839 RepID=A0ACC0WGU8_9STRA|nr:hypothetical protein PsorP6_012456 [Peronosclerospora sorghi]